MLVLLQAQVEVWSYLLDENVNVSLLLYCNRDMITINPNHLKVAYVHMGHLLQQGYDNNKSKSLKSCLCTHGT